MIIGFSVSSGNVMILSTSALISSRTSLESAYSSTSTNIIPAPSAADEVNRFIPSTAAIASSTRITTPSSTSDGDAPR
ncbi:hypothetical protein ES703_82767 [subsurface metagenome]